MNRTLTPLALLATALMLAVAGSAAASPGGTTYYLTDNDALSIELTASSGGPTVVKDGQAAHFYSLYAATSNTVIYAGMYDYTVELTNVLPAGTTFRVGFGLGDGTPEGTFIYWSENVIADGTSLDFVGAIDIPLDTMLLAGEFISFSIDNLRDPNPSNPAKSVPGSSMSVMTSGESFFVVPDGVPSPVPTPELGSIVLAGAGLGLVAVVALRRR